MNDPDPRHVLTPGLPVILCGRPKDYGPWPDDLKALNEIKDLPAYPLAEPGSVEVTCATCDGFTWIGPGQQKRVLEMGTAPPGYVQILCHHCVLRCLFFRKAFGLTPNPIIEA